jgi:ADP-ribosylglycohydrolase
MSTVSYVTKLDLVKEVLASDASVEVIRSRIGNDGYAHRSVPTAIYCFLKAQNPIKGFYVSLSST